eukprot:CAMPEP_0114459762 /NCGR_PEP_ID=MMETSP0104-20121206/5380_1 /TAXON_ID=37642 ORGANISM="Paraphysomonas imperforata, Strain PA2" /NCGR_SAMPLE_ID=MMETSP0104 /ASSEMBLY_ACC=CAM_ASM_000202 /LENGTH=467 /DNA_ID=CAMNT_0001632419 /DNA_START=99 /DNA_END=1502 /DNA_ORIENTATION=+
MSERTESCPDTNALDKGVGGVSGQFKLSIWVPTEAVGKVIGKKGAVIQHIQRESGAMCAIVSEVAPEGKAGADALWSPIVITGSPSKTLAAHDMIRDVVEEIDDAVVELSVPQHKLPSSHILHGGLLHSGRHPSAALKLLSAETGVRTLVSERRENSSYRGRDYHGDHHGNTLLITLEGTVASVFLALETFTEALSASQKNGTSANSPIPQPEGGCRFIGDATSGGDSRDNWRRRDREGDDGDHDHRATYEQYVNVPSSLVGLLLAKRDPDPSVMKQIQRGSRTHLEKLPEPVIPATYTEQQDGRDDDAVNKKRVGDGKEAERHSVVTFAVRGSSASAVELGASCLLRIVAGDKIVTVLADLAAHSREKNSSVKSAGDTAHGGRERGTVADDKLQGEKDSGDDVDDVSASASSGRGGRSGGKAGGAEVTGRSRTGAAGSMLTATLAVAAAGRAAELQTSLAIKSCSL